MITGCLERNTYVWQRNGVSFWLILLSPAADPSRAFGGTDDSGRLAIYVVSDLKKPLDNREASSAACDAAAIPGKSFTSIFSYNIPI